MKIEIKSRWTAEVLFSIEAPSLKFALEIATGNRKDATGADLEGANLEGANLESADLEGANLEGADLKGANLKGANLESADLEGANLEGANLEGADLKGADLKGAYLKGADLEGADLKGANLKGANLESADLEGANLEGANLQPIRDDLWAVLSCAPSEAEGLRLAILEGHIDGSSYSGQCACLVGTIANVRGCEIEKLGALKPNSSRPAERFFLGIKIGDTPDKSQFAKIALEWVDQWIQSMKATFAK